MRLRVYVSTNKVGSRCETTVDVDDEDVEGLTKEERDDYLEEMAREAMWQMVEWNYEEEP